MLSAPNAIAQAHSPTNRFDGYQQRVWREQDGLPQNTVTSIVHTRDGYLWAGTVEGVVRFDGMRFTTFDSANTPALHNQTILCLLQDRAGRLWLGTDGGGLTCLENGRFTTYNSDAGLSDGRVTCLFEDRAGKLWVGTESGGVQIFEDGRFRVVHAAANAASPRVNVITQDPVGDHWIGTNEGLVQCNDNGCRTYTTADGLARNEVTALYADIARTLSIGTAGGGLQYLTNGQFNREGIPSQLQQGRVSALTRDADGALWVGTAGHGLFRLTRDGEATACTASEGLPSDLVRSIYCDKEGSVWVGIESGGLSQFAKPRFTAYTTADGLTNDDAKAVFQDASGDMWFGGTRGVSRLRDGKFTQFGSAEGLPDSPVNCIAQDHSGQLWFGLGQAGPTGNIQLYINGHFEASPVNEALHLAAGVSTLFAPRDGGMWIGSRLGGLYLLQSDNSLVTYRKESGFLDDFITRIYEDRSGDLWIGTAGRGVSRLHDGKFTTWRKTDGLASDHVLSFHEDAAGALWIGTHGGGLQRFKEGKFATLARKGGLYDDVAFTTIEDNRGDLWMSCNKGIYRARLQELNDLADGKISSVHSFAYGTNDGMLSRECNGATPAGIKARDGKLWFPTIKGVVVVDPAQRSLQPPQLAIERLRVDEQEVSSRAAPLSIHPHQEKLEIDYTALSWQRPREITFRYQLVGLDNQWTEAGTRRTAYYSHLPPGSYTFEASADNGEGVWATEPASFALIVLPPFWRTWWFLSLGIVLVSGATVAAFQIRSRQLHRRVERQEEFSRQLMDAHESERRRVAAELHDSLGQRLAVIKNSAALGASAAQDPKTQCERISEQSAQAIGEVREIAHNLRPYLLDRLGLTRAIRSMLDNVSENSPVHIHAEVDDVDNRFAPEAEISIYRVLQESLNNILKHSGATDAEVAVHSNASQVEITIHDNGCGFDPQSRSTGKSSTGGFGLVGVAERVRLLRGTHTIASAVGEGTIVTIKLPLSGKLQTTQHSNGEFTPHHLS